MNAWTGDLLWAAEVPGRLRCHSLLKSGHSIRVHRVDHVAALGKTTWVNDWRCR